MTVQKLFEWWQACKERQERSVKIESWKEVKGRWAVAENGFTSGWLLASEDSQLTERSWQRGDFSVFIAMKSVILSAL
jgi:hypothetical protein